MTTAPRQSPPAADVATELNNLVAGAGILAMALFPLAVPVLVLVLGPLALAGVVIALPAVPIVLSVWLARRLLRARRYRRPRGAPRNRRLNENRRPSFSRTAARMR